MTAPRPLRPLAAPEPVCGPGHKPGLVADVERVRALLQAYASGEDAASPALATHAEPVQRLVALFGLTPFETDLLLLAAAVELDGAVAALCARLQGGEVMGDPRPTYGLALAVLPDAHWDALSPDRPLRRWHLLDLGPGPTLATRPLVIDEQVLHELTGVAPGPGALAGLVSLLPEAEPLSPAQEALADDLAAAVGGAGDRALVRLVGEDTETVRATAQRVAARLGRRALLIRTGNVPGPGPGLAELATHIDRAALLQTAVPVLTADGGTLPELLGTPIVLVTADGPAAPGRLSLRRTVHVPDAAEQRLLWWRALGLADDPGTPLARAAGEVAEHYRFGAATLAGLAGELRAVAGPGTDGHTASRLRALCRDRARVSLGGLAERLDVRAGWDDLVLPEGQALLLRDIVEHVRHRTLVYDGWRFAAKCSRGLGISALFAGESGTGKTMAAEVIAGDLGLDLYRIDLSAVVSKYIGETEKNLRRLFDAAEASGAVLLFDEADALFGKRGEVRDGHDRYANLEVAYLLQRMETYRGLAILTTNLRSNVDRAFLRRLRFVVQFPFPDEPLRARIWARSFPKDAPVDGLDPAALARLQVPGGSIRAIAVGAAFAAAAAGTPVRSEHVLHAARVEYAKAERPLTETETASLTRRTP